MAEHDQSQNPLPLPEGFTTSSTVEALSPASRVIAVAADADDYPAYVVRYVGNLVPDAPRVTIGPHTFTMAPDASVSITVTQSRNPTTHGIPDLTITIDKL